MRTPNLDRFTNQVALMHERKSRKPAKAAQPTPPSIQPQKPMAKTEPDWVNVLVGAVERDGSVTFGAYDLSILLGLPAAKEHAAMLSILEAERYSLFTKGVRYFGFKGPRGHAIHFRMLKLDS